MDRGRVPLMALRPPGTSHHGMNHPGTSHHGMGHHGMNHPGTSHHGTSHHGTGHHGMGHHGMNHHGMGHHGMNHHGMNHPGTSHHGTSHHGTSHHGTGHHGMGHHGTDHHGTGHHGMGHHGMNHHGTGHHGMNHHGMNHPGMGHHGSSSPGDAGAGGACPAPEPSLALGTSIGMRRSRTGGGHPPSVPCHRPGVTEQPCQELRVPLESAGTRIYLLTPGLSTPRRSGASPAPRPALQGIQGISTSTARPGATTRLGHDGAAPGSCSWCPGRGVPDPPEGTSRAPSPPVLPRPGGASPGPRRSRSPRSLPSARSRPRGLQRGRSSRRMCQRGLGMFWSPPARPGALWRARLLIQVLILVLQSCRWSWQLGRAPWAARVRIPVLQEQIQPLLRRPPGILRSRSTVSNNFPNLAVCDAQVEPCSVPKAGSGHGSPPRSPAAPADPARREILGCSCCGAAELSPPSCAAGETEARAAQAGPLQSLQPPESPQLPPGPAAERRARPSPACTPPEACTAPQSPPGAGATNLAVCGQQQLSSEPPSPFPAGIDSRSAAVLRRKAKIELSYQQFSLSVAVVATMLLHQEPSMEAALGVALRANLRQGRLHHLQQLEEFIDSLDSVGSSSL
ncbi:uncharacterized protein LOC106630211 isoform X6 [Zonotrichia albicollis]|uniref:uncharacterized protein LOC106630211 isoform X6 n=1 Tax=Zonotrichia albicollis TaxID=44394 RepID=UPI003D80EE53